MPRLLELYRWINNPHAFNLSEIANTSVDSKELDDVIEQTTSQRDNFVNVQRTRHFDKKESNALPELWFEERQDYDGFIDFLKHFKSNLPGNSLLLTLTYLIAHPALAEKQSHVFTTLFQQLLLTSPNVATDFYKQADVQLFLSNYADIAAILSVQCHLKEVKELFGEITHPLGLTTLFNEQIDNIELTVARVLWLIEQGVTADEIITSYVLHAFFYYHGGDRSQLTPFYQLLEAFESAKPLVQKARTTSVMTRADEDAIAEAEAADRDPGNRSAYKFMTLVGIADVKKPLWVARAEPILFDIPAEHHFDELYLQFGRIFLIRLLELYDREKSFPLGEKLRKKLNAMEDQKEMINLLDTAGRDNERLLGTIAELLDETTVTQLVESGSFAIFHLTPFKPNLLHKINPEKIKQYLKAFSVDNEDCLSRLLVLNRLLTHLKDRQDADEVTQAIYEEIIMVLMNNPNYRDDGLIKTLRKYASRYHPFMMERVTELQEELNKSILEVLQSQEGLTERSCINIRNVWERLSQKFSMLSGIDLGFGYQFPDDKYEFYTSVVQAARRFLGAQFNLQQTLTVLIRSTDEYEPDNEPSEYERALIATLAAIDDEKFRTDIIKMLPSNWMEKEYSGYKTIFELAAKQGNLGLMTFLVASNRASDKNSVSVALIWASFYGHIEMECFLINLSTKNKPNERSIFSALSYASETGQVEKVALYLTLLNDKKNSEMVEVALNLALEERRVDIINILLKLTGKNRLDKEKVGKVMVYAGHLGQLDMVKQFLELPDDRKPDQESVSDTLMKAFRAGHRDIVLLLLNYKPEQDTVGWLLNQYADKRDWDLVTTIVNLSAGNNPYSLSVYHALEEAAKNAQWGLVTTMVNINKPCSISSISYVLRVAAIHGQIDIVRLFLSFPDEVKPDQSSVSDALRCALPSEKWELEISAKRLEVILYLLQIKGDNKPDEKTLALALRAAVKAGRSDVENVIELKLELLLEVTLALVIEYKQWLNASSQRFHKNNGKNHAEISHKIITQYTHSKITDIHGLLDLLCEMNNPKPKGELGRFISFLERQVAADMSATYKSQHTPQFGCD